MFDFIFISLAILLFTNASYPFNLTIIFSLIFMSHWLRKRPVRFSVTFWSIFTSHLFTAFRFLMAFILNFVSIIFHLQVGVSFIRLFSSLFMPKDVSFCSSCIIFDTPFNSLTFFPFLSTFFLLFVKNYYSTA